VSSTVSPSLPPSSPFRQRRSLFQLVGGKHRYISPTHIRQHSEIPHRNIPYRFFSLHLRPVLIQLPRLPPLPSCYNFQHNQHSSFGEDQIFRIRSFVGELCFDVERWGAHGRCGLESKGQGKD